jgi:hypothetical protein
VGGVIQFYKVFNQPKGELLWYMIMMGQFIVQYKAKAAQVVACLIGRLITILRDNNVWICSMQNIVINAGITAVTGRACSGPAALGCCCLNGDCYSMHSHFTNEADCSGWGAPYIYIYILQILVHMANTMNIIPYSKSCQ